MTPVENRLDTYLQEIFERARAVPPLDSQAVAEERTKFLAQGKKLRATVSPSTRSRHNKWMNNFVFALLRKERSSMVSTLMAIVISLALVFGSTGATVYAAQGSMPDELLYPVKTWSEDARLAFAGSSQAQLALTLEFANRRIVEMTELEADGKAIPANLVIRMQNELEASLQVAAGMENLQMTHALEQIRLQAETQSQMMAAITNGDPALVRLQERLQEQVQLALGGISDPAGFRLVVRERQRDRQNNPSQTPNPSQVPGNTHTPPATPQPTGNHSNPGGPNSSQTPMPTGNSYGPGPGAGQPTGTPGHYGPGEPNPSQTPMPTGDSYGPGPGAGQPTGTPGGYGPGPGVGTMTCTPENNGGPGNGSNPSQTPPAVNPGSGSQNPTSTPQPGGPGPGESNQPTATPEQNGDPGSGQPTTSPGQGGGGRP